MRDLVQEILTFLCLVVVNNSNQMSSLLNLIRTLSLAVHPISIQVPGQVKMCGLTQKMHIWKLMLVQREMKMEFIIRRFFFPPLFILWWYINIWSLAWNIFFPLVMLYQYYGSASNAETRSIHVFTLLISISCKQKWDARYIKIIFISNGP